MTLQCKMCGAEFETSGHWAKFCPECRKRKQQDYNRRRYLEKKHDAEVAERYAAAEKQRKDMNEVLAKADAAGLSYGQYVAEEERKKEAMKEKVVQPELSRSEKSGKPPIIKWLVEQANETLRDAEGSDLNNCALIGKAIGLLTAAEMLMEGEP